MRPKNSQQESISELLAALVNAGWELLIFGVILFALISSNV